MQCFISINKTVLQTRLYGLHRFIIYHKANHIEVHHSTLETTQTWTLLAFLVI